MAELSVALLVVVMLIVASSAQMTSFKSISSYGVIKRLDWLHVEGQWIVDEDSNRVQLRGAGGDYYAYNGGPKQMAKYLDWLKETGCNVIRLAFCVPGHRVAHREYDPVLMDEILDICEQKGIYAVLDAHHYWATKEVQGWDDVLPKYKAEWIQTWVQIATRYKNRSVIAAYELVNEPYGSGGKELRDTYYEAIDAIRATGDNHIVVLSIPERTWIYEADGRETTWSNSSQVPANAAFSIHNWHGYNPDGWFKDDESGVYNVAELVASEWLATATYYREKLNAPVILGEFGTYNYDFTHPNVREMQLKIQMAEQLGLSWWAWMLDQWNQYAPNFWIDFVNTKLGGAFNTSYISPKVPTYSGFNKTTFPALPFNLNAKIINYTRSYEPGYDRWGVAMIAVPQDNPITFGGPCKLRVQIWGNNTQPYWGTIAKDYYIDIAEGATWTYPSAEYPLEGYTVIYAWEG